MSSVFIFYFMSRETQRFADYDCNGAIQMGDNAKRRGKKDYFRLFCKFNALKTTA
jgi:hypothetical protein